MPDIRVVETHQLPVEQVQTRLGGFSDLLNKYGVKLDWQPPGAQSSQRRAQLKGVPGVGGHIEIRPTEVEVFVTLSRLVTMMGLDPQRLEGTIRRRLGEALRP